jgi:hypothetical protein
LVFAGGIWCQIRYPYPRIENLKITNGQSCVVCGVWCVVCGVWCVVCGVWCVVCGVLCVVCGVWCVVCGVWCVVCGSNFQPPKRVPSAFFGFQLFLVILKSPRRFWCPRRFWQHWVRPSCVSSSIQNNVRTSGQMNGKGIKHHEHLGICAPPPPRRLKIKMSIFSGWSLQYFNNFLNAYNGERDGAKVLIIIFQN